MRTGSRVAAWAIDHPWALTRDMLRVVGRVLARHVTGDGRMEREAFGPPPPPPAPRVPGAVAVLPIHGVLAPRINMLSDFSGGATFEEASAELAALVADPAVATIVLDWDSPGGSVAGAGEFAERVGQAATVKRVISVANFQMCSAAYWAGARSTEIVAAPSALVGSIGVYCLHEDLSQYLKNEGIVLTYISAGTFKVDGNPTEPLSDTARARLKALVSEPYERFVADVARGRGVTADAVRSGFGEGATLTAAEALAAGLVDRVETLEATLARVAVQSSSPVPSRVGRAASELALAREIAALGFMEPVLD